MAGILESIPVDALAAERAAAAEVQPTPIEGELPALPVVQQPEPEEPVVSEVGDFSNDPAFKGKRPAHSFDPKTSKEIAEETSPTQKIFENVDGSRTAMISQGPVRFRDAQGQWQEIDLTPTEAPEGIRAARSERSAVVRRDVDGASIVATTPAGEVRARHLDARSKEPAARKQPVIEDETVIFVDALPGRRDVTIDFLTNGWEESVVLPSAEGAPGYLTEFEVPEGTTAREVAGSVEFVDAEAVVYAVFGGGFAHDAEVTRSGLGAETEVRNRLVSQSGTTVTVEVSVDEAWLQAPDRAFPVVIDPVFWIDTAGGIDTWVQNTFHNTAQAASTELRLGTFDGGATIANTMMKFKIDVPTNPRYQVTDAKLRLYNKYSASCVATGVNLATLTASPTTSTVWGNQPGTYGDIYRYGFAKGYSSACPAGFQDLEVNQLLQRWLTGWNRNDGIKLWAMDERDSYSWKKFDSHETGRGPSLIVTYTTLPNQATPKSPAHNAKVVEPTPVLSINPGSDAEGDPLRYWFKVATGPNAESGSVAESGWISGTTWQIPPSVLQDGVTYYWKVMTWDGQSWPEDSNWTPQSFKMDLRLGIQPANAYDSAGSVQTNLYNGNVIISSSGPTFATVGGDLGFTFTYNSRQPQNGGLIGQYFDESMFPNRDWRDDSPYLERRDPNINFSWGNGAPVPGMSADNFITKWTGFVTVPTTGSYHFGAASDDGVRVTVGTTKVFDRWRDGSSSAPQYGTALNLNAGQAYPILVEHYENGGGAHIKLFAKGAVPEQVVPAEWLSTTAMALPERWTISADLDGAIGYTHARITEKSAALVDSGGGTHTYTWSNNAYKAPAGEDGILTKNSDGSHTLQSEDGTTYVFDVGGRLQSATSTLDDKTPAAAKYVWRGSPARLTEVVDPVSGRKHILYYSGAPECPPPPAGAGFDGHAPTGMLCGIKYWDGTWTKLRYKDKRLARIVDPGPESIDFGYSPAGKLAAVREPAVYDAVKAKLAPDDDTTRTLIHYVDRPLPSKPGTVTMPAPRVGAPAAERPQHSYVYGARSTDVRVAGMPMPAGYERRVEYNLLGQTTRDTDAAGKSTTFRWSPGDLLEVTNNAATGLRSTTIYDDRQQPVEEWGPAPVAWFRGTDNQLKDTPQGGHGEHDVPHTVTRYDEGVGSLAATYYKNKTLSPLDAQGNSAVRHDTVSGGLNMPWGTGAPADMPVDGFSARFSGDIRFPAVGDYKLEVDADDGVRVYLDDKLVINSWSSGSGWKPAHTYKNTTAGARKRIRVEYFENTGGAHVKLHWTPPGGTRVLVPASQLSPRYGLTTTEIDADRNTTKTEYGAAHYGTVSSTTADPAGLNLQTTQEYEPAGLRRQLWRQLPKGSGTRVNYAYYGNTQAVAPPAACGGGTAVNQGGLRKQTLEPVDSAGARIDRRTVYDVRGREIATSDDAGTSWSCTTYDGRGRVISSMDRAGRKTTTEYSPGGNIVTTTFTDSANVLRTTRSESDFLGRIISYTDEWGTVNRNVYDRAGRLLETHRAFFAQPEALLWRAGFDGFGRASSVTDRLSGVDRTTTYGYDTAGRMDTVSRPNGVVTTSSFDPSSGQLTGIGHTKAGQAVTSWSGVRRLGGDLLTETTAGRTRGYRYDRAGRLTRVDDAGTIRNYVYDRNTNRCGLTATTTCDGTNWVYDNADRLLKSPGRTYAYDKRGNVTKITPAAGGATSFTYDPSGTYATVIDEPTQRVEETLAPDSRVLIRKVTNKATNQVVEHTQYGYDDKSDSPAYQRPVAGGAVTSYLDGPGGILAIQTGANTTWPLGNARGDIIGTTTNTGAYTAKPVADEFGKATVTGDRLGWLGMHQRYTVANTSGIIRMGHRLYDPTIGRFLQVDPIEGGSANDYDYVAADPINNTDLDGQACWRCWRNKAKRFGRRAWKYRDQIAFGLAVVGMFACTVCTVAFYAGMAIGAASTGVSCARRQWASCAAGASGVALGGMGRGFQYYGRRIANSSARAISSRRGFSNSFVRGKFRMRRFGGRAMYGFGSLTGVASTGASSPCAFRRVRC